MKFCRNNQIKLKTKVWEALWIPTLKDETWSINYVTSNWAPLSQRLLTCHQNTLSQSGACCWSNDSWSKPLLVQQVCHTHTHALLRTHARTHTPWCCSVQPFWSIWADAPGDGAATSTTAAEPGSFCHCYYKRRRSCTWHTAACWWLFISTCCYCYCCYCPPPPLLWACRTLFFGGFYQQNPFLISYIKKKIHEGELQ